MALTTLNIIINDLLDIIRGSEVVKTEPISKMQIETWVHQYRALLIKRELEKDNLINPDYIQTLSDLDMEESGDEYVTTSEIPNTVFKNTEPGFTWIGSYSTGEEYQYMTQQRSKWVSYRRYTSSNPYTYLLNNKLYSNEPDNLTVKGLFENPMEVARFNGPDADYDSAYPIPVVMIPTLKEMILKNELQIEASAPNDDTNDSVHNLNK
jgi:hypothetical protein